MKVRKNECRFCGSIAHGYPCAYSTYATSRGGLHVEVGDDGHCIYCGSTSYGYTCSYNPGDDTDGEQIHVHGHSDEAHHGIFDATYRQLLRHRKVSVEGHIDNGTPEQCKEKEKGPYQCSDMDQITGRDGQDVAKEIG